MLPDIEKLLQLQIADKEIRKLQEEIAALPKRVAVIESKLASTKAQLEKARTAAKADETNRKKFEAAIADLQGKISKYRDQSLAVKTNDQYKAFQHEIEFCNTEIRSSEDRILDLMSESESLDKNVKSAEAALKVEKAEVEGEKQQAHLRQQALVPRQRFERRQIDVPREEPVRIPRVAREQPVQILGLQIASVRFEEFGDAIVRRH